MPGEATRDHHQEVTTMTRPYPREATCSHETIEPGSATPTPRDHAHGQAVMLSALGFRRGVAA